MLSTAYKKYRPMVEIEKFGHPAALSNRMGSPAFLFDFLGAPIIDEAVHFNLIHMANASSASLCLVKIAISV
jgi:hypothetical protein